MVNLDTNEGDAGEGFLENLEITGTSEDFIKFAGTITGYGAIVDSNVVYYVWAQDDGVYVDDGGNGIGGGGDKDGGGGVATNGTKTRPSDRGQTPNTRYINLIDSLNLFNNL